MNTNTLAALQLFEYGLTPIPLIGKRPIVKNWSKRFLVHPLYKREIINGIPENNNLILFSNKNIGIITGQISNIIVLDLDELKLLPKLKEYGEIPPTWTVKSSRGYHFYFKYMDNIPSTRIWDGIDILADKKMVVAPPSVHPSGQKYYWIKSPKDTELAELPTWLISLIRKSKNKTSSLYKSRKDIERDNSYFELMDYDWIEFYSRHVSNIKGNGIWLNAQCPFHDDQNNSFSFNKEHGGWVCFAGCGKGNSVQFMKKIYNISYREVLDLLEGSDIYA
ncbi:bifunctional DNA primase/polymerase [Lentibacillus cibarius]|uniref:DNA primase n=1 Tax=Lentibacillus cibarius TaxID=2583219 RepID=A0A5S3QJL0_9BACI|nr:bifunctional DNA primase/polymerase [Lentibacillus cibarius]TMN21919.1 hypothetical protein FFL34_07165 [Lentibacillus cibarius]